MGGLDQPIIDEFAAQGLNPCFEVQVNVDNAGSDSIEAVHRFTCASTVDRVPRSFAAE